jgi:hypothetical protein
MSEEKRIEHALVMTSSATKAYRIRNPKSETTWVFQPGFLQSETPGQKHADAIAQRRVL